jgi:hypothetical protein
MPGIMYRGHYFDSAYIKKDQKTEKAYIIQNLIQQGITITQRQIFYSTRTYVLISAQNNKKRIQNIKP